MFCCPVSPLSALSTRARNSLDHTFPVGNNPVAMAETPNAQKLYVANHDDNSISGFTVNSGNLTTRTVIGSFNAPLWVTARSDSQRVYVLNGNGVLSTIDTTSTAGPDNVIDASITAPSAAYMFYDVNKNRLYIPGGTELTILNVAPSVPAVLGGGPITTCDQPSPSSSCIPTVAPGLRNATDPCSTTAAGDGFERGSGDRFAGRKSGLCRGLLR